MIAIIKFYACNTVKIYKNKPQINFNWGGGGPGSAFASVPLAYQSSLIKPQITSLQVFTKIFQT